MTLNDTFFEHIKEAFAFKENEVLDPAAHFKDHWNWNSMTALLTISMFLSEYNQHVSSEEFIACLNQS